MRKSITLFLLLLIIGCSNTDKEVTFEIASTSSGTIMDGEKSYESHEHKWKSSDGAMVTVELIKFGSNDEARSYLESYNLEDMSSSEQYDGRISDEGNEADTLSSITLWKENKLVKIKAPNLNYALAFEKCCSKKEFDSF